MPRQFASAASSIRYHDGSGHQVIGQTSHSVRISRSPTSTILLPAVQRQTGDSSNTTATTSRRYSVRSPSMTAQPTRSPPVFRPPDPVSTCADGTAGQGRGTWSSGRGNMPVRPSSMASSASCLGMAITARWTASASGCTG